MDFFEHQAHAKKQTRLLVVLFALSVSLLIFLTNLLLLLFPWQMRQKGFQQSIDELACLIDTGCDYWQTVPVNLLWITSTIIIVIIGGVSLLKWFSIRRGGRVVAESLGGTMLCADTKNRQERQLLNIVEEMALAANLIAPPVYILRDEQGVNAFAAGLSHQDAVIGITQGALDLFNRDQLQGVVAHEFSHILNGDMRLNMHLIALLQGIIFVSELGFALIAFGSSGVGRDRRHYVPTWIFGLCLVVLGSVGVFFGHIIKAAVSRQREFLADASAVQFTRNPDGIIGALNKLANRQTMSLVHHAKAIETSHLFFSRAVSLKQSLFATHPPLRVRIHRLRGSEYAALEPVAAGGVEIAAAGNDEGTMAFAGSSVGVPPMQSASMVTELVQHQRLHHPLHAAAAVCCLLIPKDEVLQQKAVQAIAQRWPALSPLIEAHLGNPVKPHQLLPVIELSASGLRLLTDQQYQQFKQLLLFFIMLDNEYDLFEWCVYEIIKGSLDGYFAQKTVLTGRAPARAVKIKSLINVLAMFGQSMPMSTDHRFIFIKGSMGKLGFHQTFVDVGKPTVTDFSVAVKQLSRCSPRLKAQLLGLLVEKTRGSDNPAHEALIRAVAMAIQAPYLG